MLDDGQVTDSKGTKVDFKNCIVIFTSNISSKDIIDHGGADDDQALMKERVDNAMRTKVGMETLAIKVLNVSQNMSLTHPTPTFVLLSKVPP